MSGARPRSPACRTMRGRPARRAGYTMIEVMMGIALSAIGILGISFMQTTSVRSNQDAFESMIATNFARTWLERVKRDALLWNTPGAPVPDVIFAGRPGAGNNYFTPSDTWTAPRPMLRGGTPQEASGANYHGVEVGLLDPLAPAAAVANADIYYCAHLRFRTVQTNALNAPVALSVDARVYWARKGSLEATQYNSMLPARNAGCDDPAAVYSDAQIQAAVSCAFNGGNNYCLRVHYLHTVVRMVPL